MGLFLFPCEPGAPLRSDPEYAREAQAALVLGHAVALVDHDALERGDVGAALSRSRLPESPTTWAWRGWMMHEAAWRALVEAMQRRGHRALVSVDAYVATHHAPGSAALLEEWTARTVFVAPDDVRDEAAVSSALASFGGKGVV